jgi:ComF family protein
MSPPRSPSSSPPPWRGALDTLSAGASTLLRFLWPGRCGGCNALRAPHQPLLCDACASLTYPCGAYPSPAPALIDRAWACFEYTQPIQRALHAWKYAGRRAVGADLARALTRALPLTPTPATRLIPIPLHPARLRARGFDQTYDLARDLARALPTPTQVLPDYLRRDRFAAPQVGLSASARADNVAGAFSCPRPLPPSADIWLIDDVSTTGATACACAAPLRAAGAASITLITIARAATDSDSA